MKLFKFKLTYKDGKVSDPVVAFGENFSAAVHRVETIGKKEIVSMLVQEVPRSEAIWWGRIYDDPDELAVEYENVPWDNPTQKPN